MSTMNIYDMADTWNDGATTFSAIKMNVTDTASASGSLLMDLQVGGASKFSVSKAGQLRLFNPNGNSGTITYDNANRWDFASVISINAGNGEFVARSLGLTSFGLTADTILARDAANTLAQRNGVNAQTFRLYNTFTDASNYERGFMRWNSNTLEIGSEAAGTGTARNIKLQTSSSILKTAGGQGYAIEAGSIIRYASGLDLIWSNSTNAHTGLTADVGIKRADVGQLQITDGSTGTGQLIFIVPTTDPGITGALWNNAGTLAISA